MSVDFDHLASAWRSIDLEEADLLLAKAQLPELAASEVDALAHRPEVVLGGLLRRERQRIAGWAVVTACSVGALVTSVAVGGSAPLAGLGLGGLLGGAFSTREALRRAAELREALGAFAEDGEPVDFR